ncbi:MAG: hypothetical protein WKG03_11875 [Telluria sp.]
MRKVVIRIAVVALMIPCVHAAPAEIAMTEERNVAVGFAATQHLVITESLVNQCRTFNGVGEQADEAYQGWIERNAVASRAAWAYLVLASDAVAAQQGAEAGKKFHADRKTEFAAAAKQSLLAILKDGIVDTPACKKLVAAVDHGVMDISNAPEHYQTLQQIDAEILRMQPK